MKIGERIAELRKAQNMTQERLAERLECSPQFISDMERGVVGISLSTLKKLCLTLGVSSDSILFGAEPESSFDALAGRSLPGSVKGSVFDSYRDRRVY